MYGVYPWLIDIFYLLSLRFTDKIFVASHVLNSVTNIMTKYHGMTATNLNLTWLAYTTRISSIISSLHFVCRWSRRGMSGSSRHHGVIRSGVINEKRRTAINREVE